MKKNAVAVAALACLVAAAAYAAPNAEAKRGAYADRDHVIYTMPRGMSFPVKGGSNLSYHGGEVMTSSMNRIVFIFWGPSFASGGADNGYATSVESFRNQFGTTPEYNTITQYTDASGAHIKLGGLGTSGNDVFDTSAPPTNVTDTAVQNEVKKWFSTTDPNTIYEVVIPKGSYSSSGSSTSCGGPSLSYCAYHGNYGDTKYSIQPYPSCSGCTVSGWTAAQNQEHFVCHETREAVTDPLGTGWWAGRNEADDKCAWSPTPFIGTGGFGYQYEWSNADRNCVKTK